MGQGGKGEGRRIQCSDDAAPRCNQQLTAGTIVGASCIDWDDFY
jgi:hypothetical protein